MTLNKNHQAFFALVRAGLWESKVRLLPYGNVNYSVIFQLAEEQSVTGLITAGLEHIEDVKAPQEDVLQFIGSSLQIEQQNMAMNVFVAKLIEKLRKEDVYTLLVKGQGIAQCYERPLWRASGDVDLLLNDTNYEKAKKVLIPLADGVEQEYKSFKHIGMTLNGEYVVELHGTMHSRLSKRIDRGVDEAQNDVFFGGSVRSWQNGNTQVFLPRADEDVIFVFTHILHHFYIEGIGLRQICDWCRLLWTFRDSLNYGLLESRIRKMGLMSEWKAFAAFAVDYLGMPIDAMPFYDSRFKVKGEGILEFVFETGNFGHNRDYGYYDKYPYLVYKTISFWKHIKDGYRYFRIFPLDSLKVMARRMVVGFSVVLRGKRSE